MFLRLATLLLLILMPLSVAAQRVAPVTLVDAQRPLFDRLLSIETNPGAAGSGEQVVPLWASPDGRLLAIVGLSRGDGAPALPPSPAFGGVSDLRIVDATDLFSAGLRLRLADGLRADLLLGLPTAAPMSYDLGNDSGCLSNACLGELLSSRPNGVVSANLGVGWTSAASSGPDLSFGLSWLDGRDSNTSAFAPGSLGQAAFNLAMLDFPGIASYKLNTGRQVAAHGIWQLDQGRFIDLTATLGRAELAPVWYGLTGPGLDLSQASLGLGLASGSLRGSIVGRVSSMDEPGVDGHKRWSGLDLGVSWRTPWHGELTVGAQNLFSAPLDASSTSDADATQARMPYVQYRQDL